MKTVSLFAAVVLTSAMSAWAEDRAAQRLAGVWERVEIHFHNSGETMTDNKAYLIFTKRHFSYIDNSGNAHWGTYTVKDNTLVRHRVHSNKVEVEGTDSPIQQFRFDGTDLILSRVHPDAGPIEVRLKRIE